MELWEFIEAGPVEPAFNMAADEALLEWSGLPPEGLHVLLSKADKLSRSQGLTVLREVQAQLAGRASVQLMSSLKRTGLDEARAVLKRWCAADAARE